MKKLTRYVCAAVYTNGILRDKILEIFENEFKIIAESHGLEVEEVVKHCYKAKSRIKIKNILLFFLGIISLMPPLAIIVYPLAIAVSFFYKVTTQNNILRKELAISNSNHSSGSLRANTLMKSKVNQVAKNIVYYDGFSPFIGSGINIGAWSFAINSDKPATKGSVPQQFKVSEIYTAIEKALLKLNFQNLSVQNKLIVSGAAIRNNGKLLPNQLSFPLNEITDQEVRAFMDISNKNARYYQLIQIRDWEEELIFSVFIRFYKNDKNLFVESSYYLLLPLKEEFKTLKSISPSLSISSYIRMLSSSFFSTFFEMIGAIIFVYSSLTELLHKFFYGRNQNSYALYQQVMENPNFNYGAIYSIRELVSGSSYQQYFQKLDKEMYLKIVEKRILNTIMDFLERKNIDTSEFKERETQILNNGIIITGGSLKANNVSVGKKSKITQKINQVFKTTED